MSIRYKDSNEHTRALRYVPVDEINVSKHCRPLDPDNLDTLAESMRVIGLAQPILVYVRKSKFWVVAGRHRLAAAIKLGWAEVACIIVDFSAHEARLARHAENLHRGGLTALQRAIAVADWADAVEESLPKPTSTGKKPRSGNALLASLMPGPGSDDAKRKEIERSRSIKRMAKQVHTFVIKAGIDDDQKKLLKIASSCGLAWMDVARRLAKCGSKPTPDVEPTEGTLSGLQKHWMAARGFRRAWATAPRSVRKRFVKQVLFSSATDDAEAPSKQK